jgi:hypothetical protein
MSDTKGFEKATDWIGTNSSKEARRSWYHAIDTWHVHTHVKFERWLSIQFGKKKRNKKFSKRMASC